MGIPGSRRSEEVRQKPIQAVTTPSHTLPPTPRPSTTPPYYIWPMLTIKQNRGTRRQPHRKSHPPPPPHPPPSPPPNPLHLRRPLTPPQTRFRCRPHRLQPHGPAHPTPRPAPDIAPPRPGRGRGGVRKTAGRWRRRRGLE
ncbi:hypothetical protein M8818_005034 [Zalaria obscura]|uniref:Uncharacterized protein n=1 Tax=Zalaria obscura TaxID=2024903 RepID=A0ACC3SAT6_9PEZI